LVDIFFKPCELIIITNEKAYGIHKEKELKASSVYAGVIRHISKSNNSVL
jgi:hypothetical protein